MGNSPFALSESIGKDAADATSATTDTAVVQSGPVTESNASAGKLKVSTAGDGTGIKESSITEDARFQILLDEVADLKCDLKQTLEHITTETF